MNYRLELGSITEKFNIHMIHDNGYTEVLFFKIIKLGSELDNISIVINSDIPGPNYQPYNVTLNIVDFLISNDYAKLMFEHHNSDTKSYYFILKLLPSALLQML